MTEEEKGGWTAMGDTHNPGEVPSFLQEFLSKKVVPREPRPVPEPNIYEIEWSDGTTETIEAHGMGLQGYPGNAFQIMVFGKVPEGGDPDTGMEPIRMIPLNFSGDKYLIQVNKIERLFSDDDIPRP